ncbi:MAG: beta-ketoacyl synthase N-terminal-like domain-containing protein, partial [Burkholderiaceae bacterium]
KDELYITGRIKDLIIIRGRNHYPQDIEQTAFRAHAAVEIGHGAAFSVEDGNEEKLVIVQEIRRSWRKRFDGAEVAQAICAAVAEQHGLQVHALLLLKPASVHITSSGKIQRQACKADFLHNRFEALFTWPNKTATRDGIERNSEPATVLDVPTDEQYRAIAAWLAERLIHKTGLPKATIQHDVPFSSFGCDSVDLVALSGELSSWLGRIVEPNVMYDYPTITRLSRHLSGIVFEQTVGAALPARGSTEPMAIIGMACRFPGAASVDAYWQLLEGGSNAITEVPMSRWQADRYYEAGTASTGKMNTRWGGFIDGVDQFDADFFGISPREADSMDPQQRLLLETAWHALETAGIPPDSLAGSRTGVFIGICSNDYRKLQLDHLAGTDTYSGTGNAYSIAANRLSYFLDLRGPSLAIDTACSSSLVAVHQACASLRTGECDLAIVGGVNLILSPENTIVFSQAKMMAPDGQCKTFDASADGYVRSEGCGVVVLKRYSDALSDNDQTLGLVAGSAVNQDGKSNGLTAPNGPAQEAVVRDALVSAAVAAARVSYVEAHGTGTNLGDPIEMAALKTVYGESSSTDPTLWIGSVKTNIGHLEAAAGIAGMIKVVLAMQHRRIPPHLHLQQLNPKISLEGTRCAIPTSLQTWSSGALPRIAGISSFGFGGTNAHVLLQESSVVEELSVVDFDSKKDKGWHQLVLSAKSNTALAQLIQRYIDFLTSSTVPFTAICHTAATHRSHHPMRFALLSRSREEAIKLLKQHQQGEEIDEICTGVATQAPTGKVAFLFTGQGAQYARMGVVLYQVHAGFRQTLQRCDCILQPLLGQSLLSILSSDADLTRTSHAQPALFALEYALATMWLSCGIKPDYLIGHSLGEYVAACVAGVFSLEDGLKLVAHRGRLMQSETVPGAMVAVHAPTDFIAQFLESFNSREHADISLAARNSPQDIVLSGEPKAVEALAATLSGSGATVTQLHVTRAFHSPLMQNMIDEFKRCAETVTYHRPQLQVISNITGKVAQEDEIASSDYWVRHVLAPVLFAEGLSTLAANGCRTFVEIGPHPVLTVFGQQMISDGL